MKIQSIYQYFNSCCGLEPFCIVSGATDNWSSWFSTNPLDAYYITVGPFSGCASYSGSSLTALDVYTIYNSTPIVVTLNGICDICLTTYPCEIPNPPVVTPPIVDHRNECGIITILPMIVECEVLNPTSYDSSDGEVSVSITGGTPPYTVTWLNNGNISPALNGLMNGSYTATTVDYYGDYTATTVCKINTDKNCEFSGSVTNYTPSPLPIGNTYSYYTIKITGGTSPGPYTIYYNQINPPSSIATIYGSNPTTLATGLSYSQLTGVTGVNIQVPSETTVLYLYNETCPKNILTLIPTKSITYNDFCMTFENTVIYERIQFTYAGINPVNNTPYWWDTINYNITIKWNGVNWIFDGWQPYGSSSSAIIKSSDSVTSNPPKDGWDIYGYSPNEKLNITTKLGTCSVKPTMKTSYPVSVNQPTCLCDGSIIFNVNLDNPPFSYSIDNGVTYTSSPIFTNLCSGIYNISITDSIGTTFPTSVTLDKPNLSTTYFLSLSTTNTTPISNEISLVNSYETIINITPPLPDGTTITFDLIHNNSFYSSPSSNTSILTTGTVLTKNNTEISINNTVTSNTQSVNTTPGCQSDLIYQLDTNDTWNSITLTNLDTITISTNSRVDKTTTGLCVVGYSNDTYSISNATISGCDCCSLIINT